MNADLIGPAAVILDDLLCGLTADQADELRAAMPPAWLDQVEAATREALVITGVDMAGARSRFAPVSASPEWLRLGTFDTLLAWLTGSARTCMHNPAPPHPQPVFAAAWKPRLVVCADCVALLRLPRSRDTICDRCGHDCQGIAAGDPIYPIAMVYGEFLFRAGVCADCQPTDWAN